MVEKCVIPMGERTIRPNVGGGRGSMLICRSER